MVQIVSPVNLKPHTCVPKMKSISGIIITSYSRSVLLFDKITLKICMFKVSAILLQ